MILRTLIVLLATMAGSLPLAGCLNDRAPQRANSAAVCEAMRPSFPIAYHGGYRGVGGDSTDTISRIRAANARFIAACH